MRTGLGWVVLMVMERVVYPFRGKDFGSCKVHNSLGKAQENQPTQPKNRTIEMAPSGAHFFLCLRVLERAC